MFELRINKLTTQAENLEGGLKVPPLLLLLPTTTIGRRAPLLTQGEPVALLKAFLGRPNGAKDHILKEEVLEGKAPLCFNYKVNRDVDLQRGLGEIL